MRVCCSGKKNVFLVAINKNCFKPPKVWKDKDDKEYELTKEGVDWVVTDLDCPELGYQKIRNWVNKTNIKQLGDKALQKMVDTGLVNNIPDLYRLKADDLENLDVGNGILGRSLAEKIIAEIDKTRKMPIDLFMGSLGIKFLGRSMGEHIGLNTVDEYLSISVADLANKDNMGPNKAADMKRSIDSNADLINELKVIIDIGPLVDDLNMDGVLSGMTFCFTECRPNSDEQARMKEMGAIEKSSVSKKLSYLVMADPTSNTTKAQKARKYGIDIISYEAFKALLV